MNISDILILGPEILLTIYALMSILFASFFKHESSNHFIFNCTILMFLISALIIYLTPLEGESNIESICCDGGQDSLGHPAVYYTFDDKNEITCSYCGKVYKKIIEDS